jgi:two-component system sensor histidine kinase DesK
MQDKFNPTLCVSGLLGAVITLFLVRAPQYETLKLVLIALYCLGFFAVNVASFFKHTKRIQLVAVSVQIIAFFAVNVISQNLLSSILLVIIAGQLPFIVSMRKAVGMLIVANISVMLYQSLVEQQDWLDLVIGSLLYIAFQLFSLAVSRNVVKEQQAREELELKNAQLAATQQMLAQTIRHSERLQLSRDLHDICGHQLTALTLNLEFLSQQASEPIKSQLLDTKAIAKDLLSEIRKVVRNERAQTPIDLKAVINELITRLPTARIEFTYDMEGIALSDTVAQALFRVCQEGLTNAMKYGQGVITLKVYNSADGILVDITNPVKSTRKQTDGIGLNSMAERMAEIGAKFTLVSRYPCWTIQACVPFKGDKL